jgi:hypothetical protein
MCHCASQGAATTQFYLFTEKVAAKLLLASTEEYHAPLKIHG